jgi:hypothetical protein
MKTIVQMGAPDSGADAVGDGSSAEEDSDSDLSNRSSTAAMSLPASPSRACTQSDDEDWLSSEPDSHAEWETPDSQPTPSPQDAPEADNAGVNTVSDLDAGGDTSLPNGVHNNANSSNLVYAPALVGDFTCTNNSKSSTSFPPLMKSNAPPNDDNLAPYYLAPNRTSFSATNINNSAIASSSPLPVFLKPNGSASTFRTNDNNLATESTSFSATNINNNSIFSLSPNLMSNALPLNSDFTFAFAGDCDVSAADNIDLAFDHASFSMPTTNAQSASGPPLPPFTGPSVGLDNDNAKANASAMSALPGFEFGAPDLPGLSGLECCPNCMCFLS